MYSVVNWQENQQKEDRCFLSLPRLRDALSFPRILLSMHTHTDDVLFSERRPKIRVIRTGWMGWSSSENQITKEEGEEENWVEFSILPDCLRQA